MFHSNAAELYSCAKAIVFFSMNEEEKEEEKEKKEVEEEKEKEEEEDIATIMQSSQQCS